MTNTERLIGMWLGTGLCKEASKDDDALEAFRQVFPGKTFDDIDEINAEGGLGEWYRTIGVAGLGAPNN